MERVLLKLVDNENIIPLLVILMGTMIPIVAILAGAWKRVRQAEYDAGLKHRMLEQGMSADDIKKVLEAGSGRGCGSRGAQETAELKR